MPSPEPGADATWPPRPRCLTYKRRKVKCTGGPEPCENCRHLRLGCTFNYPESAVSSEPGDPHNLLAPTETLTEAGTRRRRIANACAQCRAQKAKCSGHRPQCFHCNRRNLTCVYPSSPSRRKSRHTNGQPQQSASPESSSTCTLSQGASYEAESTLQQYMKTPSLNTSLEQTLLSTDVIRQHLEVFFDHVYPLGYDFFHRPSMMEEFYAGKLPPIICTSVCAAAAIFVSRSRESRVLSIQWAKEVDGYIFANLNVFKILNIQLMALSKFQNFAYRQFGKAAAGARAYVMILFSLRCEVLRSTKAIVLQSRSDSSPAAVAKGLTTLKSLQSQLANFLAHMPSHIQPSELNMFSH
ncbi:putative transcriptional regulatory protein [Colletotrichum aenigma]|uniref:putative transcriptional regulatory protein n=1 Tax=Colletotrichum aenigma TaxID=1215731 RepID=UPI00187249D4|nr:putative transcriptional regulatory protein [Colletotrichum aenigma]KAF5507503.1 putative transcriptional regulatory protein [Colletotrichum aenigma]